jgi:hypothetical protein
LRLWSIESVPDLSLPPCIICFHALCTESYEYAARTGTGYLWADWGPPLPPPRNDWTRPKCLQLTFFLRVPPPTYLSLFRCCDVCSFYPGGGGWGEDTKDVFHDIFDKLTVSLVFSACLLLICKAVSDITKGRGLIYLFCHPPPPPPALESP